MVSMQSPAASRAGVPFWRGILLAGLAIGTLDLVFASAYWALGHDVPPIRILHGIAAGLLGAQARHSGAAGALLGVACHYVIATCMVGAYFIASVRMPVLRQRVLAWGAAYGALLYVLMTWVVVPLSNAPRGAAMPLAWTLSSIAMHVLIGVLCAWFARRWWSRG
jgi:hypothetical protein